LYVHILHSATILLKFKLKHGTEFIQSPITRRGQE
jgi:hypothetical protein